MQRTANPVIDLFGKSLAKTVSAYAFASLQALLLLLALLFPLPIGYLASR
jgi:hypothetical protein